MLRVLGNLLDVSDCAYESAEAVRVEALPADCAEYLNNRVSGVDMRPAAIAEGGLERVADVPIHFADPLVRRASALQRTKDAAPPSARISVATLERLGLSAGERVRVARNGSGVALTVVADDTVAAGCVRLAAAHASTAEVGPMYGTFSVERA